MSGYSNNPGNVRIDLFRDGGKWYASGSVNMSSQYNASDLHSAVFQACRDSKLNETTNEGWPLSRTPDEWLADGGFIICLEPHSWSSSPIMLTAERVGIVKVIS